MLDYTQRLVDTSYVQGACDFGRIRQSMYPNVLHGAIVKLSEGADIADPDAGASLASLDLHTFRYKHGYHFCTNAAPGAQLYNWVGSVEAHLGELVPGDALWLDVENHAPTGQQLDLAIARDVLSMARDHWAHRVGWYSNRSIADQCLAMGEPFTSTPLWLACPDGDREAECVSRGAILCQFSAELHDGTTKSALVLQDVIVDAAALDALSGYNDPQPKGMRTMVLFQDGNDVWLWGGANLIPLLGLPDVYSWCLQQGYPNVVVQASDANREWFNRVKAGQPGRATATMAPVYTGQLTLHPED